MRAGLFLKTKSAVYMRKERQIQCAERGPRNNDGDGGWSHKSPTTDNKKSRKKDIHGLPNSPGSDHLVPGVDGNEDGVALLVGVTG